MPEPQWEFPNRVHLAAYLLPRIVRNEIPLVLDACTRFVDPVLARVAQERGYRLIVCDAAPQEAQVVKVALPGPLPWGDREFRGVISTDTLEHLDDPQAALREFHRLVEPGGFLILGLPIKMDGPKQLKTASARLSTDDADALTWGHKWDMGTDIEADIESAGWAVLGRCEAYCPARFDAPCTWLLERGA